MYFESKNSQNSCTYNGPLATVAVLTSAAAANVAVVTAVADAVAGISSNWGHSWPMTAVSA